MIGLHIIVHDDDATCCNMAYSSPCIRSHLECGDTCRLHSILTNSGSSPRENVEVAHDPLRVVILGIQGLSTCSLLLFSTWVDLVRCLSLSRPLLTAS